MCFDVQVVWRPYLEEGDEGQPWLVQARRTLRSLGLRQSVMEFPSRDRTPRPGRSFRGLYDTTDWHERAKEQIQNWEHRGKAKVYKGTQRQVDVAGETASLRVVLYSAMQDREIAQREAEQLWKELERVRRAAGAGASSSRAAGSQSDLEDRLAAVVRRAEEAQTELAERVDAATGERDQLRIRAEAAELLVAETTWELATLRVQRSSVDQTEMARLCTDATAQQIRIDELWV
ncbi:hypothetical protein Taro_019008 [Colocasia esculenta]|uniref:Uncharacterized protein n=1 Tax=Colocasia esculenta TaxID=4460 RepID=A0A843UVH8_COLES|nr:hypothetical protein [Colocasia esculenta]